MKLTLKNIENKILKEVDCGLTAESGDFKTLAENVIAMYRKTEEERLQLGMNGQTYYKVHFQKKPMNYSIPFGIKLKIQYVTEYILICGIPKTMILKGC